MLHDTHKYICGFEISDGGYTGDNAGIDGMKIKFCDIECDDGSLVLTTESANGLDISAYA